MHPSSRNHPSSGEIPWSGLDLGTIHATVRRLISELSDLVRSAPTTARRVTALAEWLQVDRSLCQRIVLAVRSGDDPEASLVRLPGLDGVRAVVAAFASRGSSDRASIARATAAVEQYADLIERAGSKAKLERAARALGAHRPAGGDNPLETRRGLWKHASALMGLTSDVTTVVQAYREHPAGGTELVYCVGHIGLRRVGSSAPLPLILGSWPIGFADARDGLAHTLASEPALGFIPGALLREFCSDGLPLITARTMAEGHVSLVDLHRSGNRAHDVVLALRQMQGTRHPRLEEPPVHNMLLGQRHPTKRLVVDAYLHREFAAGCRASAGHFVRSAPGAATGTYLSEFWYDQLADGPSLDVYDAGSPPPPCAYDRQAELTSALFLASGLNPAEFELFRLQIEYPVWGAVCVLSFDFSDQSEAG